MKKKLLSMLLVSAMALSLLVGCGGKEEAAETPAVTEETAQEEATEEVAKEITKVKFYGKCIEYTSGPLMTDAVEEMLKDEYEVESIQIDWSNQDTVIRTGIASGDPCDVYNYTAVGMSNFADMALDLTPYLEADPEWKAQYTDSQLELGTLGGKIINLPWEKNGPVILANKTKLDELGITIPESWTMAEFMEVCQTIKDAGFWPLANATDLNRADWFLRNAMMSEVVTSGKYEDYVAGNVKFTDPEGIRALENTKALYDKEFMYPGEGAVTAKSDEIRSAFYQGDVIMMPETAAQAGATAAEVTDFDVVAIPWPSSAEVGATFGSYNGFFVPANAKNIEGAVAAIKAFTSPEVQAIHAEYGYIPANAEAEITNELTKTVVESMDGALARECPASVEFRDYRANQMLSELILGGGVQAAAEGLEAARLAE